MLGIAAMVSIQKDHAQQPSELVETMRGRTIAAAGVDSNIKLWDAHSGKMLRTLQDQSVKLEPITSVAFSSDG